MSQKALERLLRQDSLNIFKTISYQVDLEEGIKLFYEIYENQRPPNDEVDGMVEFLLDRVNPHLGIMLKIDFACNVFVKSSMNEIRRNEIILLFLKTQEYFASINNEEGLESLSSIKNKFPEIFAILDTEGNA